MGGGILTGGVYDSYMIFHTWLYMIPFSPWFYTWFYCVACDFTRFLYFHKWFHTTPSFPHDSFISTWFLQSFIFLDDFTYNPSTYISTSFPYSHTWFYMIPFFFHAILHNSLHLIPLFSRLILSTSFLYF